MTLFKDKYRIESARLKGFNYSRNGYYFVTICTRDKECVLGDVLDGEMSLSPIGEIIAEEWQKTEQIRSNVSLDVWIVMPNHLHGIIIINNDVETHCHASLTQPDACHASLHKNDINKFGPQKNNLASIIRGFKSAATNRIRASDYDFAWQARFYDHVIRDERSLEQVRKYIIDNPLKWELEKDNPLNLYM